MFSAQRRAVYLEAALVDSHVLARCIASYMLPYVLPAWSVPLLSAAQLELTTARIAV